MINGKTSRSSGGTCVLWEFSCSAVQACRVRGRQRLRHVAAWLSASPRCRQATQLQLEDTFIATRPWHASRVGPNVGAGPCGTLWQYFFGPVQHEATSEVKQSACRTRETVHESHSRIKLPSFEIFRFVVGALVPGALVGAPGAGFVHAEDHRHSQQLGDPRGLQLASLPKHPGGDQSEAEAPGGHVEQRGSPAGAEGWW